MFAKYQSGKLCNLAASLIVIILGSCGWIYLPRPGEPKPVVMVPEGLAPSSLP